MRRAHDLFVMTFDQPIKRETTLEVVEASDFLASVALKSDTVTLSTGVVVMLDELWSLLLETTVLTNNSPLRIKACNDLGDDPAAYSDSSLTWLCLHELMHVQMDHALFMPDAQLVEVAEPQDKKVVMSNDLSSILTLDERPLIRHCLEMQADSEATDIFIGLYSDSRWEELRLLTVFVFVVMAVIERENIRRGSPNITHPRAGTRFFTLVGHLFQMWSYPNATLEKDTVGSRVRTPENPTPEQFDAYAKAVLAPSVNDAVMVAAAVEAANFLEDIGGQGALFQDLFKIQYADDLTPDILITDAAKDWLRLMPINEKLLHLAGVEL